MARRSHNPGDIVESAASDPVLRVVDPTELNRLRSFAFDSYQRLKPRVPAADLPVRIIDIDEAALADLPEKQRTALLLCREGELSYEEIATVLGTSLQATKSLIHRAREVLKARLKPHLRSGTWTSD